MDPKDFGEIARLSSQYAYSLNIEDLWREFGKGLLNQNAKTGKQQKGSNETNYGLELVPAILLSSYCRVRKLEEFNLCPNYTNDCLLTCLYFSGFQSNIMFANAVFNGQLSPTMKKRIRRTVLYLLDKQFFFCILRGEIKYFFDKASKAGKNVAFRLNTFSDIDFTSFIKSFPISYFFYDYTKVWGRSSLANYHLTYSASLKTTDAEILEKLKEGNNVAFIFEGKTLPSTYLGYPVIDGDIDDNRYLDGKGLIIGLRRKTTLKRKESK